MKLVLAGTTTLINKKLLILKAIGWTAVNCLTPGNALSGRVALLVEGNDQYEKAFKIIESWETPDGRLSFGPDLIDEALFKGETTG